MWLRRPSTQPLQVESNRRRPATQSQCPLLAHNASAKPTREHHPPGTSSSSKQPKAEEGRGGHLCTEPWDTQRMAFPLEYEKDFLPCVWQPVQCSCILNFRDAFDSKQLYMIVKWKYLQLRWKIFSSPCMGFVSCKHTMHRRLRWLGAFHTSSLTELTTYR